MIDKAAMPVPTMLIKNRLNRYITESMTPVKKITNTQECLHSAQFSDGRYQCYHHKYNRVVNA